jgi:hypothetical protein
MGDKGKSGPHPLFFVFVTLSLLLHEYAYKDFLIDDAFISFRYAENLVAGYGLTFNRVGPSVEGYTNFLWIILFAGVHYLSLDPVITSKVLGCLLSLLSLGLTYKIGQILLVSNQEQCVNSGEQKTEGKLPASLSWTLLPPIFLAVSGPFAAWAMGGLETHLVTTLNLLALQSYLTSHFLFSVVFFTLTSLTRPDGILWWLAIFLMHLYQKLENGKQKVKSNNLSTTYSLLSATYHLLPLLGFGLFWIWRWQYYGDFLPNTYYMKTGGGLQQGAIGVFYVLKYILSQGGFFPFLLFYFFRWKYDTYPHRLLLAQIGFYLIFIITSGGDWMPLHRFIVPLLPILAILNTEALRGVYHKLFLFLEKTGLPSSSLPRSILSVLIALLLIFPLIETFTERPAVIEDSAGVQSFIAFGKWLGKQVPPQSLIAVNPVGAIPYYARLDALDMTGLTDFHIAHLRMGGLHQKYDSNYILSRKPDFIILIGQYDPKTESYKPRWKGEDDLFRNTIFQSSYQLVDHPTFQYKKFDQILLFRKVF